MIFFDIEYLYCEVFSFAAMQPAAVAAAQREVRLPKARS